MRVVLSGGGTGGHIYPALALGRAIKTQFPGSEFLYIGTEKGLESRLVPEAGLDFKTIHIQGIRRSLSWRNMQTAYYMLASVLTSKKLLLEFKPDVVIGTGGYVCGPVLYAASRLGYPTLIHEQNSIVGLTTRFLSRYVNKICVSFPESLDAFPKQKNKVILTGNPRGQEVIQVKQKAKLGQYGLSENKPTVLIFGGSRGARRLNEVVQELLPQFAEREYQVLIVTGDVYYEEFVTADPNIGTYSNIRLVNYISDMPQHINAVDLLVCRSGATTLTELTALGRPSILIPSPNVTANHQEMNARSLSDRAAAKLIVEADLDAAGLLAAIDELMDDPSKRELMGQRALECGITDANDRLIHEIKAITERL